MRSLWKQIPVLVAGLLWASGAAAQHPYPLIFDSMEQLKGYGVALALPGSDTNSQSMHFANRCYYYGDGGVDVSISDELLGFYKSQGFSKRSACLALVSGIRFNPETGQRLATYILVDRSILKPQDNNPDALSNELPLSLPKCFAGGRPYSDCAWNFDPDTGKKLNPNEAMESSICQRQPAGHELCRHWTAHEAGKRIEAFLSGPNECVAPKAGSNEPDDGALVIKCKFVAYQDSSELALIAWNTGATLIDYSGDFPQGHGYALYAVGWASPEVSADAVKAAFNGEKPRSQIDPNRLRELWGTGTK